MVTHTHVSTVVCLCRLCTLTADSVHYSVWRSDHSVIFLFPRVFTCCSLFWTLQSNNINTADNHLRLTAVSHHNLISSHGSWWCRMTSPELSNQWLTCQLVYLMFALLVTVNMNGTRTQMQQWIIFFCWSGSNESDLVRVLRQKAGGSELKDVPQLSVHAALFTTIVCGHLAFIRGVSQAVF